MSDKVKIVKVGAESASSPPPAPVKSIGGKKKAKKSMKTYPRGVLKGGKTAKQKVKIEGVRDPAKAPPVRKSTLRILTEKGAEHRRKQIKHTVRNMPIHRVRETLQKAGVPVSNKAPPEIARDILEGGMEAGMIVVR
jgi:hypothetical protein